MAALKKSPCYLFAAVSLEVCGVGENQSQIHDPIVGLALALSERNHWLFWTWVKAFEIDTTLDLFSGTASIHLVHDSGGCSCVSATVQLRCTLPLPYEHRIHCPHWPFSLTVSSWVATSRACMATIFAFQQKIPLSMQGLVGRQLILFL